MFVALPHLAISCEIKRVSELWIWSIEVATYVLERRKLVVDAFVFGSEGRRLRPVEKKVLGSNHGRLSERLVLLGETSRVPRNQAAPSDVTGFQHQHDNALETDTSTVRRTTPLETVEVVGHRLGINLGLPHLLFEEDGVVNMLSAGKDLFASDEDIVRVGQLGVFWIGHSVERASAGGELIY